jgi:hypothetical protein
MGRFGGAAASGWSGAVAAYGRGLASKSKSIKDGWEVGSSCRIGFLGELTGMGVFPDTASIVGQSVGASWMNSAARKEGPLLKSAT